jgi:hypothetical protein
MYEKVQVVSLVSCCNLICPVSVGLLSGCRSDQGTMDDIGWNRSLAGNFRLLDDEPGQEDVLLIGIEIPDRKVREGINKRKG